MKKSIHLYSVLIIALYTALMVLSACGQDEEPTVTKEATVFRYIDPGFVQSWCWYVVQTDDGEIFVPGTGFFDNDNDVKKLFREDFIVRAQIAYRITEEKFDPCYHNPIGFVDPPPYVIEVTSIERIRNQNPVITKENITIRYDKSSTENCAYIMQTDDGNAFVLSELKNEFRKNGIKVTASYYLTDEIRRCGSLGAMTKAKVVSIRQLN